MRLARYLWYSRRILAALGQWIVERLEAAGVSVHHPDGAFYLFPDFSPLREVLAPRGITTSAELCERLLDETGVAILPGSDFGRPPEELTARLAYVDFDGTRALAAAEGLPRDVPFDASFLETRCAAVLEAITRITGWLHDASASDAYAADASRA